jgi:hypothetical protein
MGVADESAFFPPSSPIHICEKHDSKKWGKEMKPSIREFELKGDSVIHVPTNAMWSAFPGSPAVSFHRPSNLGSKRPNGVDYHPEEVGHIARKLLAARLPVG